MTYYRKRLEAALTAGDRWFAGHIRVEDLRSLLSEAESLRADITGLEDGNMTFMSDQLDKAKAENAAQAVELERMREALGMIAEDDDEIAPEADAHSYSEGFADAARWAQAIARQALGDTE